ncbi:LLM class flavin-dependent oxidoreductase [Cellulomonas xylanilytica]|uniref:Putative monooxygenase (Luciferase-like) n=1 Tax=Cellulomonas xylanilytica TaxID=233583 RepID=A0A510V592_9CELL|nr:LLM class flavin-dependent oxidoreductase [Cellulomonas xylanilytica]GEK21091.1 putative monooxygenase (luciferase-like) [Cellulomonas xylanilytica]
MTTNVPLSILELATVGAGQTGATALRASLDLAVAADRLGYHRLWFAEHHLAPGVASAAPAVLAALAAERTRRLRVGSGAVLLGTTSPLVAAEQFGTIAALHPGRVDLGLGRAFTPPRPGAAAPPRTAARDVDGLHVPGTPPIDFTDPALRARVVAQQEVIGAGRTGHDFRAELQLVLDLRAGAHVDGAGHAYVSPPVAGADLALWVLASSGGESARVAGALGLPLAANYHVSPSTVLGTVEAYRAAFRPGVLAEPYVVVSADVLAAETTERARHLADPFAEWVLSIRRGAQGAIAYPEPGTTTPWEQRSAADRDVLRDRVDTRIVGTPDEVAAGLSTLQRVTGADELLVTTETHDARDRVRSFELLADAWGLPADAPHDAYDLVPSGA